MVKFERGVIFEKMVKDLFFIYWFKIVFYSGCSVFDLVMDKFEIIGGFIKDPRTLGVIGIQWHLDMIEMNYDYFVKGESHDW